MSTFLYSIFHLNIAYSSIAEKDIPEVVKRCYWPLLRLAEKFPKAVSIEASGYTIEKINEIDPKWIDKLKKIIHSKKCEFLGSGYVQMIGPLVPAEVNERNLAFGNEIYQKILGMKPEIAFVNEQAYGQGLLKHYKKAGYKAIITEWNNPAHFHPEWNREMSYYPQIVEDQKGGTLPIIWNNSTHFQRFQRYVHDEIDLKQYLFYINSHKSAGRYLCLYGSDVEVFDFRPGRFHVEAPINNVSEWKKIGALFKLFSADKSLSFVLPSEILLCRPQAHTFKKLRLESAEEPLPVKKQEKYNIARWGLTGRKTIEMNTACYELYALLKENPEALDAWWKELCFFWSSDFRTHTELKKEKLCLSNLSKRLALFRKKSALNQTQERIKRISKSPPFRYKEIKVKENGTCIIIASSIMSIVLNRKRGLTIESLTFNEVSDVPLIMTLHQGYYEDVDFNADFFSGNTILDVPGFMRITDLSPVKPTYQIFSSDGKQGIAITGIIRVGEGTIKKTIFVVSGSPEIKIEYLFSSRIPPRCSFRAGIMTFNPEAFDEKTLFYACHNGGFEQDIFPFGRDALKVTPVSLLASARRALGNTTGVFEIGDKTKVIQLKTEMQSYAALPMLQFEKMSRSSAFFLRSLFSLQEFDDTTTRDRVSSKKPINFNLTITARKK